MHRLANSILILRLNRLGHLPSAQAAAEILSENGYPIRVIEFGTAGEGTIHIEGKIPKTRISCYGVRYLPRTLRPLLVWLRTLLFLVRTILKEGKPRMILSHGLQEDALTWIVHRLFGIAYAGHIHEVFFSKELSFINRLFYLCQATFLKNASLLIFSEKTRAEIYQSRFQLTCPIFIALNCTRLRLNKKKVDLRKRYNLPKDSKLMLYLGGIGELNGLEQAVETLPHFPTLYFLLVGWGHPSFIERLRAQARKLNVAERLLIVGVVDDKWEYLDNCDLGYCIYGSSLLRIRHVAGASNKLMEYIAAGLPVIAVDRSDFNDIVDNRDIGICAQSLDPQSIARAVETLLSNPMRWKRLSLNGIENHRRDLNYEVQFAPVLKAIEKLMVRDTHSILSLS